MTIRVLMVDVDGVVVVHPDPAGWAAGLERDLGLSKAGLQAAFFAPHFGEVMVGRAPLRERLEPVLAKVAPHLTCQALIDYWFENDAHLDHGLLDQLAACRAQGLQLHLATLQEHERAGYLWRTLGLRDRFDAIHYSADLGWAKPADGFYAEIERRAGFAPEEIFFIDDKAKNVEAARRRGWGAAVWTGRDRLDALLPGRA